MDLGLHDRAGPVFESTVGFAAAAAGVARVSVGRSEERVLASVAGMQVQGIGADVSSSDGGVTGSSV